MKKLILITVILFSCYYSQAQNNKEWEDTRIFTAQVTDSVFWPEWRGDISGYSWTVTFESVDLTGNIILDIGGSNNPIAGTHQEYSFDGFQLDSLPYTFNPNNLQVITNQDTAVQKSMSSNGVPYGFDSPAYKVTSTTDDNFTLITRFNFFR